mgnify:FL=1
MRELALKERRAEPEIQKLLAEAVQIGVQSAFSAMQAGAQVAMNPMIAPIADKVMQGAGYQMPNPAGVDPNFPVPMSAAAMAPVDAGALTHGPQNTHPGFPPTPQHPQRGVQGLQTAATGDNLPTLAQLSRGASHQ